MHLMEMCQGESVKVLCLIYTHQCLFVYLIREEQVEKNRRVLRNNMCQLALVLKLKVITLLQHFYCVCIQHINWQNIELEGDTRQNLIILQKYKFIMDKTLRSNPYKHHYFANFGIEHVIFSLLQYYYDNIHKQQLVCIYKLTF